MTYGIPMGVNVFQGLLSGVPD